MRGHIRPQGKNSWQITVDLGVGPDGKRRRHFETVRGGKRDGQRRLNELLVNLEKGITARPGRVTVAEYLRQWLRGYVASNCSPRTLDGYTSIVERHLIPHLGNTQLKALVPEAIQEYYSKASERLSPRTIHHHHRVLSQALKHAVRQGLPWP